MESLYGFVGVQLPSMCAPDHELAERHRSSTPEGSLPE